MANGAGHWQKRGGGRRKSARPRSLSSSSSAPSFVHCGYSASTQASSALGRLLFVFSAAWPPATGACSVVVVVVVGRRWRLGINHKRASRRLALATSWRRRGARPAICVTSRARSAPKRVPVGLAGRKAKRVGMASSVRLKRSFPAPPAQLHGAGHRRKQAPKWGLESAPN